MGWQEVESLQERLRTLLPRDGFSRPTLKGAMIAARDHRNPIRGNLFAAAMRELITHTLHTMAPDDKLQKCSWYVQEIGTKGPMRRQRAAFITQGGLSDEFVTETLNLDPAAAHIPLVQAIGEL